MKDTIKFSSKLFVCILLVAIISFFVVITVGLDSPELVVVDANDQPIEFNARAVSFTGNLCAIATTFFLCVMIYHYSWDKGFKDYNRQHTENDSHYIMKGFVCGFIAIIPILIIGALALNGIVIYLEYVYKILVAPFIHWYNKMMKLDNYLFCQFIYLIVPLVSGISYIMGRYSFMPLKLIMYKNNSSADKPVQTSAMNIMNEKNRNNLK